MRLGSWRMLWVACGTWCCVSLAAGTAAPGGHAWGRQGREGKGVAGGTGQQSWIWASKPRGDQGKGGHQRTPGQPAQPRGHQEHMDSMHDLQWVVTRHILLGGDHAHTTRTHIALPDPVRAPAGLDAPAAGLDPPAPQAAHTQPHAWAATAGTCAWPREAHMLWW